MKTAGKMPPSKFSKNNPESSLSEAEKIRICNWVHQMEK